MGDDALSWKMLGSRDVRQRCVYDSMRWSLDVDLSDCLVAGATCGGAIAVTRNLSKHMELRGASDDDIMVYSAVGQPLARIARADEGTLMLLAWSTREQLYCVYDTGAVDVHDIDGKCSTRQSFKLFDETQLSGDAVVSAVMSGDSLALLCQSRDGAFSLLFLDGLDSPAPKRLPWPQEDFPPGVRPTCMAVVEQTVRSDSTVLLGSSGKAIVVVPTDGGEGVHRQDTAAVPIQIAVTQFRRDKLQYVAVYTEIGSLSVFSSDFAECYLDAPVASSEKPPSALAWCGRDAVALVFCAEGMVALVDNRGETLLLEYAPESVAIVGEIDGVRVVSEGQHELVEVVGGRPIQKIRAIGSNAKGAVLFDAHQAFRDADAKCDDDMRQLCSSVGGDDGPDADDAGDSSLVVAVRSCMDAALDEWDPAKQRDLLQAAAYGKAFVPHCGAGGAAAGKPLSKNDFPEACKKLRVLNHLRGTDVAMPLTSEQYNHLTREVIVDRLLKRCKHRAALAIADLMELPGLRDTVLVDWACKKVEKCREVPDEALAREITARLARVSAVSYAEIATAADRVGRRVLATLLLENEPRAGDRVPILINMREPRLALEKALESGDPDLVHMALDNLRVACRAEGADGAGRGWLASSSGGGGSDRGGGDRGGEGGDGGGGGGDATLVDPPGPEKDDKEAAFLRVLLAYPRALDLYAAKLAAAKENEQLLRLHRAAGRWAAAGRVALTIAYAGGDSSEADAPSPKVLFAALKRAAETLREGERQAGAGRGGAGERSADAGVLARATEEATQLLAAQVELERDLKKAGADGGALAGGTLAATLARLVELDGEWSKRADKLAKDFKLSEPAWWWIKARTLVKTRRYEALRAWAERAHPLGFEPLVELLAAAGAREEAKKYALKVTDAGQRVGLLIELGALAEAAEAAAKSKDVDALEKLANMSLPPAAEEVVSRALAQLRR